MADSRGPDSRENVLFEKGKRDEYEVFVSCLVHNTYLPSTETVLIPFGSDERGQVPNRRKMSNRKSKLFYVSCDYLDINTAFEEQV